MLTSRNVDVAEHVNPKGLVHQPGLLSTDQSWELLRLKALPTRGDYLDIARDFARMEKLGRQMVRKCAGLPLAIVILGGILVTKPSLIEWEKVYNDSLPAGGKGNRLRDNQQEQLFNILARSYNDLPPQLKPCFLYLGKFMEDEWIDAENLYQLWIAEGMVLSSDKREGETAMQVAESYMGELVRRSMVQVRFNDLESSLTRFKSCSLHDLMRDLSLSQAKAEDFFKAIDLREGNDFHLNSPVVSRVANTRQLVFYYENKFGGKKANSYFSKKPNHQQYRSFLILNVEMDMSQPLRLGSYFANFKLLRVLALENVTHGFDSILGTLFGSKIGRVLGNLVYLRYLSLRGSNLKTFPWIHKFVLLQTLNLDVLFLLNESPLSINDLGKLAHLLQLYLPSCFIKSGKNFKLRFNGLTKLETLENFNTRWCEVKDLPKLSSLRRLKLVAVGGYDDVKEMFNYLSDIALASKSCLQYLALHITISDEAFKNDPDMIRQLLLNHKFNLQEFSISGKLPELSELFEQQQQLKLNHAHIDVSSIRITSLKLTELFLEEDPMPILQKIPTLRDLVLQIDAYMGKEMVCSATGFPKLTSLELFFISNLEIWRLEEGSMYILQYLTIFKCLKLEELPEGLIFLNSLKKLILWDMPSEFCDRVRLENGEQGPDFYKVAHVPDLVIYR